MVVLLVLLLFVDVVLLVEVGVVLGVMDPRERKGEVLGVVVVVVSVVKVLVLVVVLDVLGVVMG